MDLAPRDYKRINNQVDSFAEKESESILGFSRMEEISLKKWIIGVFIMVVVSFLAYGGLKFYEKSVSSQISDLKNQQAAIWGQQDKNLVEKLINFQQSVDMIQELIKSHRYSSGLISALAAATLPQIQWESFDANTESNQLILRGRAANYKVLALQLLAFEKDQDWGDPKVSGIALDKKGSVGFLLNISFDSRLLRGEIK